MIPAFFRLIRPHQWTKNLMLLFPPFLGGLGSGAVLVFAIQPVAVFCLISSVGYIINDLFDSSQDLSHPRKKNRPIASGQVSKRQAGVLALILLAFAVLGCWSLPIKFTLISGLYLSISIAYSFRLKQIPLVDLFCISAGFLLRLEAGGVVFDVAISEWLFLSVFLLSLFLSAGKRQGELIALGESSTEHRPVLVQYPPYFLFGTMCLAGSAVLVTYTMFVISHNMVVLSVPLCAFGLLRYLFRVQLGSSGDPTDALLKDRVLMTVSVVWALMVGWSIYLG